MQATEHRTSQLKLHDISCSELTSEGFFVSSRHRNEVEVTYDVLEAIYHETHTKMWLMYSTYLPYAEVDKSLRLLVSKDLISEERPGMYSITVGVEQILDSVFGQFCIGK